MFNGAVDIVADVHGEIDALRELLAHLGYRDDGTHPEGRRLVFLGDFTDRGPNSPAVIALVQRFVDAGLAQCVLGNHDLNILLGEEKYDNNWFYGKEIFLDGKLVPQALVHDDQIRQSFRDFFRSLPLVLERPDLLIVHACWHGEMVDVARQATDVIELYDRHVRLIEADLSTQSLDTIDRGLAFQNRNPVKVLTSGMERRVAVPFELSGKVRHEERVPWWNYYSDSPFVVFGHYAAFPGEPHGHGRAICVDYGVAKRHRERLEPGFNGTYRGKLAAFRFPEKLIVFDDGTTERVG
jgi:hypothetical protein